MLNHLIIIIVLKIILSTALGGSANDVILITDDYGVEKNYWVTRMY